MNKQLQLALGLLATVSILWGCQSNGARSDGHSTEHGTAEHGTAEHEAAEHDAAEHETAEHDAQEPDREPAALVQYLEIVSSDVDATCAALEAIHGVTFGAPIPEFGNARTAALEGGGQIGVRASMRETEDPVVRPYVLVDDIEAAVEAAAAAGGEIAMGATEMPGGGKFAIYILGGIQHGLWQL